MSDIEKEISALVSSHFPSFYQEEGENFIAFIRAYFEWLESSDNPLYHARRLLEYNDIDETLNDFVEHFRKKYLNNIPKNTSLDTREMVKHISDLYKSKGSVQSFKLLFRLLYDVNAEIYNPGDDILRASDGTWKEPVYLELTSSPKIANFVGHEIQGSTSGAKAFVDNWVRRLVGKGIIDIVYISNVRGNFQQGELITTTIDNSFVDAPRVTGSLTTISIVNGGANNVVGDIFDVVSSFGVKGKAKVTAIENGTGRVTFDILDGGTGYTTGPETEVIVSNNVIFVENVQHYNRIANLIPKTSWGPFNGGMPQDNWTLTAGGTANNNWVRINSPWNSNVTVDAWQTTNEGGFISDTVTINPELTYRFMILVKRDVLGDAGNFELRIGANNTVKQLDDTLVTDASSLPLVSVSGPNFPAANTWYVAVGYVYPHTHTGTIDTGGLYTTDGTLVSNNVTIESFKWANDSITNTSISAVLTSGNTLSQQTFYTPIIEDATSAFISVQEFANNGYNSDATSIMRFDDFSQPLANIAFGAVIDPSETLAVGDYIEGYTGTSANVRASGYITALTSNTANSSGEITVSVLGGDFNNAANFTAPNADAVVNSVNNSILPTANITGSNTSAIGIHSVNNTLMTDNTYFICATSCGVEANVVSVSTGTGATFKIGSLQGTENISLYTDLLGGNNTSGIPYMSILVSGEGSNVGFVSDVTINSGGAGYVVSDPLVFTGGEPGTSAAGTVATVDGSGSILTINLAEAGTEYNSAPTVTVNSANGSASGADLTAEMDYGYGFPKAPQGDLNNIIDTTLAANQYTLGEIVSLTSINPGADYNAAPFVVVINTLISGFNRRDLILEIENTSGAFIDNERLEQTVSLTDYSLGISSVTGEFGAGQINEGVIQYYDDGSWKDMSLTYASSNTFVVGDTFTSGAVTGTVSYASGSILQVTGLTADTVSAGDAFTGPSSIAGTIASINNHKYATGVISAITTANAEIVVTPSAGTQFDANNKIRLATNTAYNADVDTVANSAVSSFAKGIVKSSNSSIIKLKRTSFNTSFIGANTDPSAIITGATSGATANVVAVYSDANSSPMGDNAVIDSEVKTANGIATTVQVIDSGFGYSNNEMVSLSGDNNFVVTGTSIVTKQGVGEGYWTTTRGFLNSNKYLHDNDFYQEYSYQIKTGLSVEKYSEIVKQLVHVSGMKMFGSVNRNSKILESSSVAESTITIS